MLHLPPSRQADCGYGNDRAPVRYRGAFYARSGYGGFTLIELLVAVAIGSVLIAALYATFFSVVGAGATATERLERAIAAGRFLDLLSRDIEGAYYSEEKPRTGLYGTITGTSSVLLLSTYTYPATADTGPLSDLAAVRYHVEEESDGSSLSIYKESYNPYFTAPERFDVRLLVGVESLRIMYLGGRLETAVWDSAQSKSLPMAVRVELRLDTGEEFSGTYRTRIR